MTKTLSISLIIVALVIGTGIGFMISPEYANIGMAEEHSSDLGKADKNYDWDDCSPYGCYRYGKGSQREQ
jgi:hypothetical protein